MTCPLMFRFRTVDRLPEAFSVDAVRGTLVHKVLEDLFSLPAADRTPEAAREMLVPTWERFVEDDPTLGAMFEDAEAAHEPGFLEWLRSAGEVLDRYFTLEDPRRLEPAERELYVETLLDSKLLLRGFVDRLDVAPDGALEWWTTKAWRSTPPAHARRLDDDGRGRGRRPADRFRRQTDDGHGEVRPSIADRASASRSATALGHLRQRSSVDDRDVAQAATDPGDHRHRRSVRPHQRLVAQGRPRSLWVEGRWAASSAPTSPTSPWSHRCSAPGCETTTRIVAELTVGRARPRGHLLGLRRRGIVEKPP